MHVHLREKKDRKVRKNPGDSRPRPERSLILRSLEKAACDSPRFFHTFLSSVFLRLWEPDNVDRANSYVLYQDGTQDGAPMADHSLANHWTDALEPSR